MEYPLRATEEERKQFKEQGFFIRESVFSADEIESLRAGVENIHQQVLDAAAEADAPAGERIDNQRFQELLGSTIKWEWDDNLQAVRSMEPMAHLDSRVDAFVDDPRIWGPCRDLIGHEKLSLFSDKLNVKRPGGAPFPYHQEGPYWAYGAEDLEHVVSTLTYLDDGNKENGCFWVIPRSHNKGNLKCLENRGVLGGLYTDVDLLDGEGFPFEAPAGSVMFFHYNIVHGSQANRSQGNRRVVLNAYQPAGLRQWRVDERRDIKQDIDELR
jgi:ectoine hydroxylase-related dioxygenase (phytanoyl-CoA dioxygenase family)